MPKFKGSPPDRPAAVIEAEPPKDEALDQAPDEVQQKVRSLPADLRDSIRNAALGVINARVLENRAKTAKTAANAAFKTAMLKAEKEGVASLPLMDPTTGKMRYAYLRVDEVLSVDPQALREALFEYYKMREGDDDDLAIIHANDIMEKVLKAPSIDNELFRPLVEAKVIPTEVAAACSTLTPKAGYCAFAAPE